jgi:TPR repeat protein
VNLDLGSRITARRLLRRDRHGGPDALRKRADRCFGRGDNAAGLRVLLALALADFENADIAFRIGECYERGIGAIPNFVSAVRWYEQAASRRSVTAMSRLGDIYLSGRVVGIGSSAVPATESDLALLGCNRLRPTGWSVPRDSGKALHWNMAAAEQGDAEAQARLGSQFVAGEGVGKDLAKGEQWFRASADQGCAAGQFGLGALYAGTDGGKAAALFEKAAAQGNPLAKLSLAMLLIAGQGIPADQDRGAKLLTEAAETGNTEAMFRLGELYRSRGFAGRNLTMAETWLRRAGTRGHTPALLALACLLVDDLAIPDYDSAAIILREAANHGNIGARRALEHIKLVDKANTAVISTGQAPHK